MGAVPPAAATGSTTAQSVHTPHPSSSPRAHAVEPAQWPRASD
jgi:hypothetical protein